MHLGELPRARSDLERAVALYNPDRDRDLAARCSTDPRAFVLGYLSLVYWALGYPEQARLLSATAFRYCIEFNHATRAHVHVYGAQLAVLLRDTTATRDYARAVIAMADEHGLKGFHAHATILLGWALGQADGVADAIPLVQQGLARFDTMAPGIRLYYVGILAELHARLGEHSTSLRLIEGAHRQMDQTENHLLHAELCRIEGEVCRQTGAPDGEVETCFARAIDWAKRQQARSFELRAAMSLARLWRDQGRHRDACDLVRPIYEWFTEGFDTADLKETKALLDELT
jgi:predicted ATPase